jgi:ubiquinone/menaquinone biosynthesis C-methylase UbiE
LPEQSSGSIPSIYYDEQYFRHVCEGYDEFNASEGAYLSQRLAEALAVAGIAPGMAVLDVGCGRGEILRNTSKMGARAFGIDYALAAVQLSRQVILQQDECEAGSAGASGEADSGPEGAPVGVYQASALYLPFERATFDRVLMLDIVEHLYPDELDLALQEAHRVLKPGGRVIIHTAPNVWYDRYAYPIVRLVRMMMGQGDRYPRNPRAVIPQNVHVHVNEQSALSLWRSLRRHKFQNVRAWLSTPPQHRQENPFFRLARWILFNVPPFRWFFEREVFAVGDV